jgi:hypothetical protein
LLLIVPDAQHLGRSQTLSRKRSLGVAATISALEVPVQRQKLRPLVSVCVSSQDAVVLGGTYQRYVEDEDPSQETCDKLLAQLESLFNGNVPTSCADFPPLL